MVAVRPGEVEIELPLREEITRHHGYLHAAAAAAIADCGLRLRGPERHALLTAAGHPPVHSELDLEAEEMRMDRY